MYKIYSPQKLLKTSIKLKKYHHSAVKSVCGQWGSILALGYQCPAQLTVRVDLHFSSTCFGLSDLFVNVNEAKEQSGNR